MQKSKILFIHYGDGSISDSENALLNILSSLPKSSYTPVVWSNDESFLARAKQIQNINKESQPHYILEPSDRTAAASNSIFLLQKTISRLKNLDIQLVHIHNHLPCPLFILACKLCHIPFISNLLSIDEIENTSRWELNCADRIICASPQIQDAVINKGYEKRKTLTMGQGLDIKKAETYFPLDIRDRLNITHSSPIISTAASLEYKQGIDNCINILASLHHNHHLSAHLLIIGDGAERLKLEQQVIDEKLEHFVHFLGESDIVTSLLKNTADVFLSGARVDPYALNIAEAAILNIPIVAPDIGAIPLVVKHEATGLLYPAGDHDTAAQHIANLLSDKNLKSSLTKNAKEFVMRQYNIEHIQQMWLDEYACLIRANQKSQLNQQKKPTLSACLNIHSRIKNSFSTLAQYLKTDKTSA